MVSAGLIAVLGLVGLGEGAPGPVVQRVDAKGGAEYLIVRGDYPECVPLVPARAYPDGSDDSAANPGTRHTSGAASADAIRSP